VYGKTPVSFDFMNKPPQISFWAAYFCDEMWISFADQLINYG
jgi:hypothetical protein